MNYGLKEGQWEKLRSVFTQNPNIEKVVLYGSRAKGTHKPFSDVDITLVGSDLTHGDLTKLSSAIDDLNLPYTFDISLFHTLKSPELIDHIDRKGVPVYTKKIEWRKCKLGDLIETNKRSIGKAYPYPTILYLDTGSITRNVIDAFQEFDFDAAPSRAQRLVAEDDIIYSLVRPNQLHYGYIKNPPKNLVVSTGFATITCKKDVHPKFLYYYLTQDSVTEYLHSVADASTSAYPSLKPSDIEALKVFLPPLEEQKKIASILSSLDDKIDLLNRENATLEAMAETLFRHYFIENPNPSWAKAPISSYGRVVCGKTPSKKVSKYFGGRIPFIKIPDMHRSVFVFDSEDSLTEEGQASQPEKTLPPFSVMVSCIATVGLVAMNTSYAQTNQQINAVVPKEKYFRYFLYLSLKAMYDDLNAMASGGTATLNLNTRDFSNILVLTPDGIFLERFHAQVDLFFEKVFVNKIQIKNLSTLRESLVSDLIQG